MTRYLFRLLKFIHGLNPFKKAFCQVLKKLNIAINKVYTDINFYGKFKVKLGKKKFFLYHFGDTISKHTFWHGLFNTWENDTGWLWIELCKNSKNIFDIGANTGVYSLVAKTINKDANVFAFEPSKNTFTQLQKNNALNKFNIHCKQIALSNSSEIQVFYDTPEKNQTSASLNPEKLKYWEGYSGDILEYNVSCMKIDDFIVENNITEIDLMKIDVEMHEPEVIEGFKLHLEKFKPIIIIEVLEAAVAEKLNSLFDLNEYLIFHLEGYKKVRKVKEFFPKLPFYNFIIFHKSLKNKIKGSSSLFENLQ